MSYWVAGAAIAAVVVTAVGTVVSADNQRRAANQNADAQEQAAIAAQKKADFDAQRQRESVSKLLSAQRALWGKSGLTMEGTPLLTLEDTAGKGELDTLAIRFGGDLASARERSAANLSRMQGANAQTAGYFSAGSSLLSGAAQAGGYAAKKDAGIGGNTVKVEEGV